MSRVRNIAVLVPLVVLALSSSAFAGASAHSAAPFIAKRGTINITFNPSILANFQKLGILFTSGDGKTFAPVANYPGLLIAPASSEPERAPRTPLSTSKPAGFAYLANSEIGFYRTGETATVQGSLEFAVVRLGAHAALEGQLFNPAEEGSGDKLAPFFALNTRGVKPALKGRTLTLKNIPMTLAPTAASFFSLFGPGFTAGQPVGTMTIKASR
jgi:hypothetical protein